MPFICNVFGKNNFRPVGNVMGIICGNDIPDVPASGKSLPAFLCIPEDLSSSSSPLTDLE